MTGKLIGFLLIFLYFSQMGFSQDMPLEQDEYSKQYVQSIGGVVSPVPYLSAVNFNYEIVYRKSNLINKTFYHGVVTSVGFWQFIQSSGWSYTAKYTILKGHENTFFECGIGMLFIDFVNYQISTDKHSDKLLLPAAHCGIRHQNPDCNYYIRAGAGVPESIYVGLGCQL